MNPTKTISRRTMLRRSAGVAGSIVLAPVGFYPRIAEAGAGNKAMLHYQDSPNNGQKCVDCTAFKPGPESASDTGTCKVIGGPVSPNGWCMAFSRR
ncbi:high-potential iron-sulfur protein [Ralstonia solanacearum]|uniref:High-potential iron-sulfur protein n=1 Tax=Ralstonia solanacearum K60 TaxID=1091042 RepID=A0AAP7ZPQ7_RALSL|nr:high-potential iron-sulfur protein [Ralstonia solanacearum]MBT1538749.1 high-potential iron-sulfur protein [Ralstonia solanacearum]OYQ14373.1 iron oxidase [Ralstonia solanacearum K60]QOK81743.1 iron oxidase [Ralstonia solanacearum]RIJ85805.1 iron oxidase [Ralstonia solanacearum]CCF98786.1 putative iron oxidase oxidoreductase protein [Ralstonia solanacearum K60]